MRRLLQKRQLLHRTRYTLVHSSHFQGTLVTKKPLEELKDMLDDGKDLYDCYAHNFTLTVNRINGLKDYASRLPPKEREPPKVFCLIGPTGTGKTRTAFDYAKQHHNGSIFVHCQSTDKFFDGYNGQSVVLFDDFRGRLPFSFMLQLLDRHGNLKVEVKGGSVWWTPKVIFITSNTHYKTWWDIYGENIKPFERRCTENGGYIKFIEEPLYDDIILTSV